jgi:hypothetical protein
MFGFFGGKDRNKSKASTPTSARAAPSTSSLASTRQHTDIQRELVRVVLKDLLHSSGVPGNWLGCDVLVPSERSRDDDVTVQMRVLHWDERLLRYAPALERALLKGLDRFDPQVDHSRYKITWQFSPQCGCPYTELPDKQTWARPNAAPAPAANILDRRQRPRRPKAGESHQNGNSLADDFARTEMSSLK